MRLKTLKYIIYVLFLAVVMVFTCEMYLLNMDSFETEYIRTTMYLPPDVSSAEMTADLEREAALNNLKIFTVVRELKSSYQTEITVYGTEGVRKTLEENSSLSEGEYHSILTGDTVLRFDNFSSIPDMNGIDSFYFIGNMADARNFKSALIDKYSGNFPNEGYTYLHAGRNILAIWMVGLLFFILISIFEVSVIKKETSLRVILGSSPYSVIVKNILCDIGFFIAAYLAAYHFIRQQFRIHSGFYNVIPICAIIILCVLDTCVFLSLNNTNYKRNLSRAPIGSFTIAVGYVFRVVISAVIVFSMTAFISMISEYVIYKSEEGFFTDLREYSYISADAADETIESTERAMESFFAEKEKNGDVFLNVYLDDGVFTEKPCLMFNSGSEDYLKEKCPELGSQNTNGKLCFIVPESLQEEGAQDLEFIADMYLSDDIEYEVITYEKDVTVIGMTDSSSITGSYYRNPLIILNNAGITNFYNGMYILQSAHVRLSDAEWDEFVADYDLSKRISNKTNALSNYERLLAGYKRTALMAVAVLMALLILNIVVTWTVVRFICTANATEIAVKTTLGYSVIAKFKLLFLLNLITIIINGMLCICLGVSLFSGIWGYMLAGIILILVFDWGITLFSTCAWEKRSTVKALKGAVI